MRRSTIYERPVFTATPTPSPSASLSPTPTTSPTPTPSATPVGEYLWGAGDGYYGQLAQVTNQDSTDSMIVIAGDKNNWRQVSAGYGKAIYAKRSDNIWWCAGLNSFYGILGIGDEIDRSSLVQFSTDTNWSAIQTQYNSCFGLKTNGSLWGWGQNDYGNLAQNNAINYSSPVQILASGVTNFQVIDGGVARKTDGSIWCWGWNVSGKYGTTAVPVSALGIGELSSPAQIFTGKSWKTVSANGQNVLMVASDGTLWGCGQNAGGQIGDNTTIDRSSPVQVGNNTNWSKVFSGYYSSYGLKNDGTLWSWGYNYEGQLGHYTNVGGYVSSPTQVIGNIVYDDIKIFWKWVSVRDVNGKMWVWGQNSYGQLGMSNNNSISSPTQMPYPNQYWLAVGLGYGNIFGVVGTTNAPTATPEPTFAPTASATPAPSASRTPTPTASPVPTSTPAPTASRTPTPTASPVPTSTPAPTASRTPTPTASPVPTNTATPAPSATNAPTATPLPTSLPAPTPTIDTTGTQLTMCWADFITRSVGDTTAITLAGFNAAYGTLSVSSYVSGSGTSCLVYNLNRPAYSDETAITVTYNSTNCYLTRTSTGQCLPTYTNVPVNNNSTKPKPTNTPTVTPSRSPSPTPSATAAPATPTPTPSASAPAATATATPAATGGATPLTGGNTCDTPVAWPAFGSGNVYQITGYQWFTLANPYTGRTIYITNVSGTQSVALAYWTYDYCSTFAAEAVAGWPSGVNIGADLGPAASTNNNGFRFSIDDISQTWNIYIV